MCYVIVQSSIFLFSKYIVSTAEADKTRGRCLTVGDLIFMQKHTFTASSTHLRKTQSKCRINEQSQISIKDINPSIKIYIEHPQNIINDSLLPTHIFKDFVWNFHFYIKKEKLKLS